MSYQDNNHSRRHPNATKQAGHMPQDARNIASHFLAIAHHHNQTLTPSELIQAVYLAHAFMLALHNVPLVTQSIEAWQQGPVIPELYQSIKMYGHRPVTGTIHIRAKPIDDKEKDAINLAWGLYQNTPENKFNSLITGRSTPWHRKWNHTRDKSAVIKDEDTQRFYTNVLPPIPVTTPRQQQTNQRDTA